MTHSMGFYYPVHQITLLLCFSSSQMQQEGEWEKVYQIFLFHLYSRGNRSTLGPLLSSHSPFHSSPLWGEGTGHHHLRCHLHTPNPHPLLNSSQSPWQPLLVPASPLLPHGLPPWTHQPPSPFQSLHVFVTHSDQDNAAQAPSSLKKLVCEWNLKYPGANWTPYRLSNLSISMILHRWLLERTDKQSSRL